MVKHCVFCGNPPEEKTKEHVIPLWLITMTGDPNRNAYFGFAKDLRAKDPKKRAYAFDQFTFPACDFCNRKYSELEDRAKVSIEKIIGGEKILTEELSEVLNWFDKVRVGVWLGMRQLDKNMANVDPNFHIETRIGQHDRMLIVEKSDLQRSRLNVGGADNICFALTPSAFLLIINNYYFTNISSISLCARRLGFPFIRNKRIMPDREELEVDFHVGLERMMLPVLRKAISERGKRFFQPMFKNSFLQGPTDPWDSDYVKAHSMDHGSGAGNIFEETGYSKSIDYSAGDLISLEPSIVQPEERLRLQSAINILEWQLWLQKDIGDMSKLSPGQREYVRSRFGAAARVNRMLVNHYKTILRKDF